MAQRYSMVPTELMRKKTILIIFLFTLVFVARVEAARRVFTPEGPSGSPSCSDGIDNDGNGLVDAADSGCSASDAFTSASSNYVAEAESCIKAGSITDIIDANASGGHYLTNPGGYNAGQFYCQGSFTSATYYIFAYVRNSGGSKRGWINASAFNANPDNAKGFVISNQPVFTWVPIGSTDTLANFHSLIIGTAQRSISLNGTGGFYVSSEPGIDYDKLCLSADSHAIAQGSLDPAACGTTTTVDYEVLDGHGQMPTINGTVDAVWANVPAVNYHGLDTGITGNPTTKMMWDRTSTPQRFAILHTYTLPNLEATDTTDDTDLSGDTAVYMYAKFANLNRVRDSDAYLLGVNMASSQAKLDANWASGAFNTAFDFSNCSKARSYSSNVMVIEIACDLPITATSNQLILLNFRANEKVTGSAATEKGAYNNSPDDSYVVSAWGIGKLSSTAVPGTAADTTNPTVASCSAINVGNVAMDIQCTPSDNSGGTLTIRAKYGTTTGVYTTTLDGGVCQSGVVCSIHLSGLTSGTTYFARYCAVDPSGNPTVQTGTLGCGSEVSQATTSSAAFYVSTGGSGTTCSTGSPCALSRIGTAGVVQPGDTWLLKNGTYSAQSITANCSAGVNSGTASLPITVRAENERLALIATDGTYSAIRLIGCQWWVIQGLRLEGADNAAGGSEVVELVATNNLTIRRNLFRFSNRYFNDHLLTFDSGSQAGHVIEENEFYSYHRHAMLLFDRVDNSVVRRNYCNQRGWDQIPGGYPAQGGCISMYPGSRNIVENNITELRELLELNATSDASNNLLAGNIALRGFGSINTDARGNTLSVMPQDNTFTNNLIFGDGTGAVGIYLRSSKNSQVSNATVVGMGNSGIICDKEPGLVGDDNPTCFLHNILSFNNAGYGVNVSGQTTSLVEFSNAFNNGFGNFSAPTQSNNTQVNPNFGNCIVFVPAASPMHAAGLGGADIGANVLYAYQNGVLGSTKLWNSSTKKWNTALAGASISGVNDTNSIFDIEARLHPSCTSWPAGY